jgi:protein TonB
MRTGAAQPVADDQVFSADEIARAAGVPVPRVVGLLDGGHVASMGRYVARHDAIRLVRVLGGIAQLGVAARSPLTLMPETRRRQGLPLFFSGALHAGVLLALLAVTAGLFAANDTELEIKEPQPIRLVYLMSPGPGGGGGGGGLKMPDLPARAERKVPKIVHHVSSPVPPVRKAPPPRPVVADPPKPAEPPKIDPPKIDPPKVEPVKPPPQTVQAPVVPAPADSSNRPGVLNQPPAATVSAGPGTGGGTGTGAGTGVGEGNGSGIGPGTGGGAGGGPFQPGSGIDPPQLLREVKPLYTDEARKRVLEGNVVLEIVVRRDGSVGSLRVTHPLGAGLDERALEAVRQWRFAPATRRGAPVDVVVEVSVEFKLR